MPLKTFTVRSEDTGEEGHRVDAYDHEDAAEMYAEWSDIQGDYGIIGGCPEEVEVEGPDGSKQTFRVRGETRYYYSAEALSCEE